MSQLLEGLPGNVCQLDDVLVHGHTEEEHDKHFFPVLERLQDKGLTLNAAKCKFRQSEVSFLGHILNSKGISADPQKTSAILNLPSPTSVSQVRSFLGMVNHLAKFLPDLSAKTKPLRDLRADSTWFWDATQETAFAQIKDDLTKAPVLTLYDPDCKQVVSADASSYGLGAVLLQIGRDGQRRPVAYASRSLTDTEQRYAQIEKEALASVWACNRFRTHLVGLHFQIETDHKPLVPILSSKRLDELSPRLQRLRMRMMEFTFSVSYVPGKEIFTADVLSRSPLPSVDKSDQELFCAVEEYELLAVEQLPCSSAKLDEISQEQARDPVLRKVMTYCQFQWPHISSLPPALKPYAEISSELSVTQNLLLRGTRIVIPVTLQMEILATLHEGHQGVTRTRSRALLSVWWPAISSQIAAYVRDCPTCAKFRYQPVEPLLVTALPDRPWQKVGADLFESDKNKYLIVVDYFSRFFELEPLTCTTSTTIINKLKLMFAHHGIPQTLRTDNGPQFDSDQFAVFAKDYGFQHVTSSPSYPQSNGEAERFVQTAKNIVRKSTDVALGLMAHRSTPRTGGYSPAELLFGRQIRTTVPTLPKLLDPKRPNLNQFRLADEEEKGKHAAHYNKRHRVRQETPLASGTGVWIRGPTMRRGRVLMNLPEPRSYLVETESGSVRRTRRHLHPDTVSNQPASSETLSPELGVTTRSGRLSRPPDRLQM